MNPYPLCSLQLVRVQNPHWIQKNVCIRCNITQLTDNQNLYSIYNEYVKVAIHNRRDT